jgi:hypothetical protein
MKEAIVSSGHGLIEVGLYQSKDDKLVVHGVFEVQTSEMSDERSRILLEFLSRSQRLIASAAQPKPEQQESIQVQESKIALPLQNMESPRS